MRQLIRRLKDVPHLFGKCMVIACLMGGTGSVMYAFRILSRTDNDPAAVLALALAFFGTELGMMFGRDALKGKEDKRDGSDHTL